VTEAFAVALACRACGRPARSPCAWRCDCGEPFRLLTAEEAERVRLDDLPVPDLGHGDTPLIPSPAHDSGDVYLKLEGANPSGSFKDRGMAVLVGLALASGASEVICDSSGNAAAAVAAFAAAASLRCRVFVPEATSETKVRQVRAYGAELVRVPGDREAAARAAQAAAENALSAADDGRAAAESAPAAATGPQAAAQTTFYASHYWHPFFALGTRSFALEVVEQLGGRLPDHVVFPVGHGSLYLGAVDGFLSAARRLGMPAPHCHVVQSEAVHSVVAAVVGRAGAGARWSQATTLAEGIRISRPLRLEEIAAALAATRGTALTVSEDAIADHWRRTARRGVLMEPTSAVAFAGYERLRSEGVIAEGATVVIPVTGSGLKSLSAESA
jgi:threonine synthase